MADVWVAKLTWMDGCPLIVDRSGFDALAEEIGVALKHKNRGAYTVEITTMPREEFENLPEWDGP